MMDRRGVSEVVGFVLIFSLIATTTGVVYAVGFSGLEDARDSERLRNAERAFDVLADNIDDVARRGAPARATEVKLADATMTVDDPTRIEVVTPSATYRIDTRPVAFRIGSGDAAIAYEAGAIVRSDGDASIFRRDPGFVIDADRTVIAVPQLEASSPDAIGGSTTVLVRTERISSSVRADESVASADDITIRVETSQARAAAWEAYLDDAIRSGFPSITSDPCTITGGTTVECTDSALDPDRLLVSTTRMTVEIE